MTPAGKWATGITAFVLVMGAMGAAFGDDGESATAEPRDQPRPFVSVPATPPASATVAAAQSDPVATATTAATTPAVVVKTVTRQKKIPFTRRTVKDSSLDKGTTRVTKGRTGLTVTTYEYRWQGGELLSRRLVSSEVVRTPVQQVTRVGTHVDPKPSGGGSSGCDPNYSGCVPIASDVDCAGGSGNGPEYVEGPIRVIGSDPYRLDADGDGIACE